MADNTVLNPGVGGDTIKTEDVGGGVKIPVSKIYTGALDQNGGPVVVSNPLPVMTIGQAQTVHNAATISSNSSFVVGTLSWLYR